MATICPTITATKPHEYREQMEAIAGFAKSVHIDIADGQFAPVKLISIEHCWWPEHMKASFHVMYQQPFSYIERLIDLSPDLVVVHAEAENAYEALRRIKQAGIQTGLALLPATEPDSVKLDDVDHVLIFSGNLGYHGGSADLSLLSKIAVLKVRKPELEISWDGGINDQNITALLAGGVEVFNVGGFIQKAEDPKGAYAKLEAALSLKRQT